MTTIDRLLYFYTLFLSLCLILGSFIQGLTVKNLFLALFFLPLVYILCHEGFRLHLIPPPRIGLPSTAGFSRPRFKSLFQAKSRLFLITLLLYGSVIILVIIKSISQAPTFASPAPLNLP